MVYERRIKLAVAPHAGRETLLSRVILVNDHRDLEMSEEWVMGFAMRELSHLSIKHESPRSSQEGIDEHVADITGPISRTFPVWWN